MLKKIVAQRFVQLGGFRRLAVFFLFVATPSLSHAAPGDTFVATFNSSGQRVDAFDYDVSAAGRYTVFATTDQVTEMVPPDGSAQVYLYDRVTGQHELVSIDPGGEPSNAFCDDVNISADGRFVLMFWERFGAPGLGGLILRDRLAKTTQRVSQRATWSALSGDGRFVAFTTPEALVPGDTNDEEDVYLWDRQTLVTERVSVGYGAGQPNNHSAYVDVSDDGRFVVFSSWATNLVPGDTNGEGDVFVRDRLTKQTRRVSVDSQGAQANGTSSWSVISGNGQVVAFSSYASNLIPGDVNGRGDFFAKDLVSGATERVNVSNDGRPSRDPSVYEVSVNGDGRFVAFSSRSARLVPNDTNDRDDVFVRDRLNRTTVRATVNSAGVEADSGGYGGVLSRNGRVVLFGSWATNLSTKPPVGFIAHSVYGHELTSVAGLPVTLTPTTVKFGTLGVGTVSDVRLVTIKNTSAGSVQIKGTNLGGSSPDQYSRVSRCPAELATGASCTVEVRFAPTSSGSKNAKLIVNLGATYPKAYAWLRGTGS